jgi:hypothetical protein
VAVFAGAPSRFEQLRQALTDSRAADVAFDEAWGNATADYPDAGLLEDAAVVAARERAYTLKPPTPGDRCRRLGELVGAAYRGRGLNRPLRCTKTLEALAYRRPTRSSYSYAERVARGTLAPEMREQRG